MRTKIFYMKYYLFVIFALFLCSCSNSVKPTTNDKSSIYTNEDYFDFGTVQEEDSMIHHTFVLKNGTNTTQYIDHIESSCGCTTVNAECDSIVSGGECKINADIKTTGYLGNIVRDIDVFISGIEEPITLSVAAYIPMPIQAIKAKYSKKLSENVYTTYNIINIGNVYKDSNNYGYTELVNMSQKSIKVKTYTNSRLVTIDNPDELEPLIPTRFYVYYDNSSIKTWGVDTTNIYVEVEDAKVPIKCVANILPFPKPKNSKLSPRVLNYSNEIINSKPDSYSFDVRNIGAEPLKIIDHKTSKNVKISQIDKLIDPSKSGKIVFNTVNKENGFIDILTNDPLTPIVRYKISASK